jgi:hypothetical protein
LKTSSLALGANLPAANIAKVLGSPKTFKKVLLNIIFLKVLGVLKIFSQEGFYAGGCEAATRA